MFHWLLNIYQRHAARHMFSRWSPIYEEEVTENSYSAANEVARSAIKHLAAEGIQNPAIADIGIGTGLLAQQIYDALPCRVTGLDFTEDMMAVCAAREITELLIKCDAGRDHWPLEDGSQNAVVSAGLVEYMTKEMLRHFLEESSRVLQHNGLLVFTYMPRAKGQKPVAYWQGHSGSYLICGYEPAEIEDGVKGLGFNVLEHTPPFKGCVFKDESSYDYRLIAAQKN